MALTKVPYTNGVTVIGADNLNDIQDAIIALQNGGAISDDLKQALLQIAQKVAYIDSGGATYYQALYDALYPPKTAVSISAVFTQGSTVVYDNASLNSLKTMLVVTATYDDSSTEVLQSTAYTLSGTLTPGTSTVTVTYNSLTTTFTVTVTAAPTLSSISAVYTQSGTVYDTDTLDSLKDDLVVTAHYSDDSTQTVPEADYTLSGTLAAGTSTITVGYGGKTTTFSVTVTHNLLPSGYTRATYVASPNQSTSGPVVDTGVTPSENGSVSIDIDFMMLEEESIFKYIISMHSGASVSSAGIIVGIPGTNEKVSAYNGITAAIIPNGGASMVNQRIAVTANYSPTTASITDGTLSDSASGTGRAHGYPIYLFGLKDKGNSSMSYIMKARIYACKVKDNGTTILDLIPCTRDSDSAAGFWDVVNENFITASGLVAG